MSIDFIIFYLTCAIISYVCQALMEIDGESEKFSFGGRYVSKDDIYRFIFWPVTSLITLSRLLSEKITNRVLRKTTQTAQDDIYADY